MDYAPEDSSKLILVIDSDQNDRLSIANALVRAGYDALVASNGNQGLNLAERERPDLIIADLVVARRSGFLVIESLRMSESYPTRIVVLSSNNSETAKKYAEELGVDAYMSKPYVMQELLDTVERVLRED